MNEIGEILKEARIEQGYTLEDLQQSTKIQRRYLEAIEEGNSEILPGRFYARAFIKQYADIVGLDGEKLLDQYADQTPSDASEEFAENVKVQPTRTKAKRNDFLDNISEYLPTILIVLLVAAIFIVIYFAWVQARPSDEQAMINEENTEQAAPPTTEENEEAAENTEETTEAEESAQEEEAEEEEPEPAQEVTVADSTGSNTTFTVSGEHPETQTITLTANGGNSWVSIDVEGGSTEQALLEDGDTLSAEFPATTNAVNLVIGEATYTEMSLNGEAVQYAPEAEDVITQRIQFQFEQ
jgi:cytoskeletal protein RodZ